MDGSSFFHDAQRIKGNMKIFKHSKYFLPLLFNITFGQQVENASAAAIKEHPTFSERQQERDRMVNIQIQARDVKNERVLSAMRRVPRHAFIPDYGQNEAYADHPVSIGLRQTISQPYIVAFMTEALQPEPTDRVLEIGTGSGYQAAVLAELVQEVYTIEIVPELGEGAKAICNELSYSNIQYRIGDGYRGWPDAAPFDAIIVTAAPGHIPQPLVDQLAVGGTMIIPVGVRYQKLIVIQKDEKGISHESVMAVRFVPMTGEAEN